MYSFTRHYEVDVMKTTLPISLLALAVFLLLLATACDLLGGGENGDNGEEEPIEIDLPGKVVFSMRPASGENPQIFTVNTDGSELTQLTHSDFIVDGEQETQFRGLEPTWSSDGELILLTAKHYSVIRTVVGMIDSKNLQSEFTTFKTENNNYLLNASRPRWNSDNTFIAYYDEKGHEFNPYLFNLFTKELTSLGLVFFEEEHNSRPYTAFPEWSPDGTKIAFSSNLENSGWDIYLVDNDGTNLQRISNLKSEFPPKFIWGPNNQSFTFRLNDEDAPGLYQADIQSGELQLLLSDEETNAILQPLAWSDDGNYLLVNNQSALEILDINNKHLQTVYSAGTTIHGADWFLEGSSN